MDSSKYSNALPLATSMSENNFNNKLFASLYIQ